MFVTTKPDNSGIPQLNWVNIDTWERKTMPFNYNVQAMTIDQKTGILYATVTVASSDSVQLVALNIGRGQATVLATFQGYSGGSFHSSSSSFSSPQTELKLTCSLGTGANWWDPASQTYFTAVTDEANGAHLVSYNANSKFLTKKAVKYFPYAFVKY